MSIPTPKTLAEVFISTINDYWTNPIATVGDPRLSNDDDTEAGVAAVRDAVLDALAATAKAEGWALSHTEPSDGPLALHKWITDFKGVSL